MAKALRQAKLEDEFAVLGSVLAGPQGLEAFSRGAAVNTDDLPVVTHRAPWVSYSPQETPRDRLASLIHQLSPRATDVLGAGQDQDAVRLEAYWQARAKYLAFGMVVRPDADPRVMLDQLRRPLLEMVTISPDFRPAAEPLLNRCWPWRKRFGRQIPCFQRRSHLHYSLPFHLRYLDRSPRHLSICINRHGTAHYPSFLFFSRLVAAPHPRTADALRRAGRTYLCS
jgi:hypothetical protein